MTNLLQRIIRRPDESDSRYSLQQWINEAFSFNGNTYPLNTTWGHDGAEPPLAGFDEFATRMLKANPIVFSAVSIRLAVFSQARMVWRRRSNGQVVDEFTDRGLAKLQRPWPNGTTSDLLGRMLLHADTAGNAYVRDAPGRVHMMRPDRVSIVLGSQLQPDEPATAEDVEAVGYMYDPGRGGQPRFYGTDEVAHFAPMPDPHASFRGMSWLSPVVREVQGDNAATDHKLQFFRNAATPNLLVSFDMQVEQEKVKGFKELMESEHRGISNAYKTLYLGGGADATVIGADMKQLEFARTQGKGETRILMAAGIPPVVAGASEGLSGSSLNSGNYTAAKRAFSDIRLQHLWTNAVSSLSTIARPSSTGEGAVELWFDKTEIPFLQDDLKDTAEIQQKRAAAIRQLTDAGYTADSVVNAIENDDLSQLTHSGLFSVQLQPPGTNGDSETNSAEPQWPARKEPEDE